METWGWRAVIRARVSELIRHWFKSRVARGGQISRAEPLSKHISLSMKRLIALAAGDREMFIGVELAMREMLGLPPFGKLAAVIFWGPEAVKVDALAKKFLAAPRERTELIYLDLVEAPIGRLRGLYRRRLFIQAEAKVNLSAYMQAWQRRIRPPSKYKIQIDIDPQSFM